VLNKKLFIFLVLGIFLISFASAVSVDGEECWASFELDSQIQLIQKCPSCSFVNITSITYPNGTVFLNEEMEQDASSTNFNFTLPDSSQLGLISYGVIGDKDGASPPDEQTLCILITPTGGALDIQQSIIIIGLMFILLFLTSTFLYFGTKIEVTSVKIFLIALGGLFLMFTIGFSLNSIKQLMILGSILSGTFLGLYRLMIALVTAGFMAIILYLVASSVKAFKRSKGSLEDDDDY